MHADIAGDDEKIRPGHPLGLSPSNRLLAALLGPSRRAVTITVQSILTMTTVNVQLQVT
jgi:hypothetical protein